MPISEIEFEPTTDPLAVLRDSADRLATMDAETAREADRLAQEQSGGAADE